MSEIPIWAVYHRFCKTFEFSVSNPCENVLWSFGILSAKVFNIKLDSALNLNRKQAHNIHILTYFCGEHHHKFHHTVLVLCKEVPIKIWEDMGRHKDGGEERGPA